MPQDLRCAGLASFVVALALVSVPATGAAQTASFTIASYGGRTWNTSSGATSFFMTRPLSAAECELGDPMRVTFMGLPAVTLYMRLWRGTNCTMAANRMTTAGGTSACTLMDWRPMPAMQLGPTFSVDVRPADFIPCTSSATNTFWFLASTTSDDRMTEIGTAGTNSAGVSLSVNYDRDPPAAPTMVGDAAGDTAVPISWTTTSTEALREAHVHVVACDCASATTDSSGTDAGVAGVTDAPGIDASTASDAGELDAAMSLDAPADDTGAADADAGAGGAGGGGSADFTVVGSSPTSYSFNAQAFGLAVGETACVTVTLVDLAGNEGPPSESACVTRVEVNGFWDAYCRENHPELSLADCTARYRGCSCTIPGRGESAGAGLGLLGLSLGLIVLRRSRR